MGITIDGTPPRRPFELDPSNNHKEPGPTQKTSAAPSGASQPNYDSWPDANIDYRFLVQTGNNAGPMAVAQGNAGNVQQATSNAPAKSVDVDVKNVRKGDTFVLGTPDPSSSASNGREFLVEETGRLDPQSVIQSNPGIAPATKEFLNGKGPFYKLLVSYPIFDPDTNTYKQEFRTWGYDEDSKLWGFFNKDREFVTSHVGPDSRVIEKFESIANLIC